MATDDKLTAALNAIRAEWKVSGGSQRDEGRLLAAIDAVLAFHRPVKRMTATLCSSCVSASGKHRLDWPCPEYAAITAALLGEEASGGD